jgi:CBS domain-containing protein
MQRPLDKDAPGLALRRPDVVDLEGHLVLGVRYPTEVVTVDRLTSYKKITRLMTEHRISGLPVLTMVHHVAGVVSEADLLTLEDKDAHRAGAAHLRRKEHHKGLIAGEMMTVPAVTIHPDATLAGAARVMNAHHVRRLPVVDRRDG